MYKSPIEIIATSIGTEFDGEILKAVRRVGIEVDKPELMKALDYDRQQYELGFDHGSKYAHLGCEGCAYESTEEWEMPCAKCRRACNDYYRRPAKEAE